MVSKSRKSSPYFFRRVWSPFGHSIQAVRNTAGIALSAVDSAGKSVSGHLNDAVGNLVRPRRGGGKRSTQRRNKTSRRSTRRNKNSKRNKTARRNKSARRH
jgi:hypothetical protein